MSKTHFTLTADHLRTLFECDESTGIFTRLITTAPNAKIGSCPGNIDRDGYLYFSIGKRKFKSHRLVWLYFNGEWPNGEIDHIDGNPSNNALSNLRVTDRYGNTRNCKISALNTSGFKGVSKLSESKWGAYFKKNKKMRWLGTFTSAEAAYNAYCENAKAEYGDFFNPG
jgi:hypothetical protein